MTGARNRANEIKVGLFLIAALAILGVGTLWIVGFKPLSGRQQTYEVQMKGSSGVRPGDRVRISGVNIGRVKKVELRPADEWPVIFRVALDSGITISEGSTARLTTDGLLGAPYLEIVLGPIGAAPLPAGSRISGITGGTVTHTLEGLGQATDRLPALLDQTTQLVTKLNSEFDPLLGRFQDLLSEQNVASITSGLASIRPTIEDVAKRLSTLVTRLDAVAVELQSGVGEITPLASDIGDLTLDLRHAIGPNGDRLASVLDSTQKTLGSAGDAFSTVEANGAELDAMVRDLRDAAANLKSLSQTLKERPGLLLRYPKAPDRKPGDGIEP